MTDAPSALVIEAERSGQSWPETRAGFADLSDKWRRLWAQIFLGWALAASADEVLDTVAGALRDLSRGREA